MNNVSLGIYAQAVQREGYREAKLRTIAQAVPDTLGPDGTPLDLRWDGPDGHEHASGAVILVSNNPYRLRVVGAGTRPRMDTGTLGVTVFEPGQGRGHRAVLQWAVPDVRRALRRAGAGRSRRRGRHPRCARALHEPAGSAHGADRADTIPAPRPRRHSPIRSSMRCAGCSPWPRAASD